MKPLEPNAAGEATDSQLAERARYGELDAFEELVRRYQGPLLSFLKFYGSCTGDIEDVAQEAFLQCYLNIHQFDLDRNFKTWLYTIARRMLPRNKNRACVSLSQPDALPGQESEPIDNASTAETRQSIWRVIRQVTTDSEFQLIWFRYADRLTMPEIAEILDDSVAACKMRLSRLRHQLKNHLRPFVDDEINAGPQIIPQPKNSRPKNSRQAA